jgi:metallo-beta-lactamase family protein
MKIQLLGAAGGEVTGSAYVIQTDRANIMVDCGLFQGSKKVENSNRLPSRGPLQKLSAVVLTHAHLDHTGRLPLLTRFDYRGPIHATQATIEVAELILRDSAFLQGEEAKRQSRRQGRTGTQAIEPLYTAKDVDRVMGLMRPMRYNHPTTVAPGISVRAAEAGHVLGSASLELTIEEGGKKRVVVFSGDIGPRGAALHKDPVPFERADLVFLESTYGDKDHPTLAATAAEAREQIKATIEAKGRVLVPVFAVGRTQLLLYLLAGAFQRKKLTPFPIFLDSPMAIRATALYRKHPELFDEEALAMRRSGELATQLRTVKACTKAADSMALAKRGGPFLVMAGSGMCTGGRILHHMKNHLGDPSTLVLMVGYQSRGSLGRKLVDGEPSVRIRGEVVKVRARVHTFGGLSGHAGQSDLLAWIGTLAPSKPRIVLTHGEDPQRTTLARLIRAKYGLGSELPDYRETIEF